MTTPGLPIYNPPDTGEVGGVTVPVQIPIPVVSVDGVTFRVRTLSAADYAALSLPDAHTLYLIV